MTDVAIDADDPDAFILRLDDKGITHLIWSNGASRRTVCASWNGNITGFNIMWGAKETQPPFPTCVYCIGYTQRELRLRKELDGLAGIGVT